MALAIGTWAPLHRSPSQQSISHLVIFTEGEIDLQFFAPQLDELVHPLAKASTDTAELSSFTSALPQRSWLPEQDISFVLLLHSSQLLKEPHW